MTVLPLFYKLYEGKGDKNDNTVVFDTNNTLNFDPEQARSWMHSFLNLPSSNEMSALVEQQRCFQFTCAQFCLDDPSSTSTMDDGTNEVQTMDGLHVHREEGKREIHKVDVVNKNRNTNGFLTWCTKHHDTLTLDLTVPGNINAFRRQMGLELEPLHCEEHNLRQTRDQNDDISTAKVVNEFMEMYNRLIIDFQSKYYDIFSPMNGATMMIAAFSSMCLISPDVMNSLEPGSFLEDEVASMMSISKEQILEGYIWMLTSEQSPMKSTTSVKVYPFSTMDGQDGRDVVSQLRQSSCNFIQSLESNSNLLNSSSLFDQLESFCIGASNLYPGEEEDEADYSASNWKQSLAGSHWNLPGNINGTTEHNMTNSEPSLTYFDDPNARTMQTYRTYFREELFIQVPGIPTVSTLITEAGRLQLYPSGTCMDIRELNFFVVGPLIMRIIQYVWDGNGWDAKIHVPKLVGLLQKFCSTTGSTIIMEDNIFDDPPSMATVTVLMMVDSAVSYGMLPTLIQCFTRSGDSLSRPLMTRQNEVKLLGK
jgi:hypothetical protein